MNQHTRRWFVKTAGVTGVVGLAGCTGGSGGTSTTTDATGAGTTGTSTTTATDATTGTPTAVRMDGIEYFFVNNAGTRVQSEDGGPFYRHGYRSVEPLRMETDTGGVVSARYHDDGMRFRIDLTDDDKFGEAGNMSGVRKLDRISEIGFRVEGDLIVALQLGIGYRNDTIYEWESTGDRKERTKSLDGDHALLTDPLSGPSIRIGRGDRAFFDPGSEEYRSIDGLVDEFGDVPVRIVSTINGGKLPISDDVFSAETVFEGIDVVTT